LQRYKCAYITDLPATCHFLPFSPTHPPHPPLPPGAGPDSPRVFLASLKAAGLGTNLTAASNVHMMDPWWNPAVEDQAMVRAY